MSGITVAYSGVHQIYQIALAAQEIGELDQFFCSVIDAPSKWGNFLSFILGNDRLINRRCLELNPKLVKEYPWPFLLHYLMQSFPGSKATIQGSNREVVSESFDSWVSQQLNYVNSRVFIGAETCALYSFEVAQKKGMTTVLDCPQVHPDFLMHILNTASEDLNLPTLEAFDTPKTDERKRLEYSMADFLLVISEVQKRSFLAAGVSPNKLICIPLWAETTIFQPPLVLIPKQTDKLRVLFVGELSIRKGIPYLLEAIQLCKSSVELTLVGAITSAIEPFLAKYEGSFTHISPVTKARLREYYWQSGILVLPSLVDTFGWVAMEAMACGLPVIVSDNCGVPVPDESWRVPIMNSEAIAQRLMMLEGDREYCASLGKIASEFAQQFTPKLYREKLQELFKQILSQG